jgi:hypothetical protein
MCKVETTGKYKERDRWKKVVLTAILPQHIAGKYEEELRGTRA